jgi:hypothetical protein
LSIVTLISPLAIGFALVLAIGLTSGMARGRLLPMLIPNEALLFLSFGLTLPFVLIKRWKARPIPAPLLYGQTALVCGMVVVPGIAYYWRGVPLSSSEVIKILAPLQYLIVFWLFLFLPADDQERFMVIQGMWVCSLIVAMVGLLQVAGLRPVIAFLQHWYPSGHMAVAEDIRRATSLMSVWNGLGTFMMVNLLSMRAHQAVDPTRSNRVLLGFSMALSIACLLASGSYASMIGLILGYLMISFLDKQGLRELGIMLLVIVISIIPLYPMIVFRLNFQFEGNGIVPHTFLFRLKVWQEVFWPVIQENWLWGYRPSLQALIWKWSESQYLALILRSGIFSLFSHLLWIFITIGWLSKVLSQAQGFSRALATCLLATLVVLSIMGCTNEVFTFSGSIDFTWIMLGLLAGSIGDLLCNPRKKSLSLPG